MKNYSIIIPHKNIPHLLKRCLASIPERTDTEIIIVDDNSDSSIVDFDNFPGVNRSDVTILYDKSGKGVGRARNIGLQHAVGKWILFADADDYFNYCINDALEEYVYADFDAVFFYELSIDSELYTYSISNDRTAARNAILAEYERQNMKDSSRLKFYIGSPCGRLYKRNIIENNNIRFAETSCHEDVEFNYLYGFHVRTIKIDKRAIATITYRKESLSHQETDEKIIQKCHVLARRERFYREHNIPIQINPYDMWGVMRVLKNEGKQDLYCQCCSIWEHVGGLNRADLENRIRQYNATKRRERFKDNVHSILKTLLNRTRII